MLEHVYWVFSWLRKTTTNLSAGHETSSLYPFSPTAAAAAPHSLTTGNNLPSRIPTESIFARKTLQYNCWDWEECAWWALVYSLASTAHLIALACVGEQQTITQVLWRSHSALLLQRRQIWRTETRSGFQWLWCGNLPCSCLLGGFKHFSSQRHRSTLHSVNIDQQRETTHLKYSSYLQGVELTEYGVLVVESGPGPRTESPTNAQLFCAFYYPPLFNISGTSFCCILEVF